MIHWPSPDAAAPRRGSCCYLALADHVRAGLGAEPLVQPAADHRADERGDPEPVSYTHLDVYKRQLLAVAHREFLEVDVDTLRGWGKPGAVLYDVKSVLPRDRVDGRL